MTAVGLATASRVVLQGTNRVGRSVVEVIEGEELAKYRLRRARKGSLVTKRIKVVGFDPGAAAAGVRRQFVIPLAPRGSPPPGVVIPLFDRESPACLPAASAEYFSNPVCDLGDDPIICYRAARPS